MPRVVIAGVASGVGKTTVATGLMAALAGRGLRVAPAKVGPDFIDPGYHALATGRPGRNLDPYLVGEDLVAPLFAHGASGADVAIVEGVMGLFDGRLAPAGDGAPDEASTAHVARLLDAPVVLVVDVRGMARSVAALVGGYAAFDRRVRVAGVIANRVGSDRHAAAVADALAPLGIPLLGALRREDALAAPSRHLGLVPVDERRAAAAATVRAWGDAVAAQVDLDSVLRVAGSAPPLRCEAWAPRPMAPAHRPVVAVAAGPAFTFGYAEHLELLAAAGADVATFDPCSDERLPSRTAAVVLGGGFPEAHADVLAANVPLRAQLAAFAAAGGPIVAECGGLLYLCRTLDGTPQCGVVAADARLGERLVLGYREAVAATASPLFDAGDRVRAHEFHHGVVEFDAVAPTPPAWRIADRMEGVATPALHASWLHVHWAATPQVATRLVAAAARQKVAA